MGAARGSTGVQPVGRLIRRDAAPSEPMSSVVPGFPEGPGLPKPMDGTIQKGILATPDLFGGYARLAARFRAQGHADRADSALRRAVMIAPEEARLWVNQANLRLTTGVAGGSDRLLRRALCLDPGLSAAIERLLLIHKASGDIPGADRVAGWLIARGPKGDAMGLLERAAIADELGERDRATRLLNEGLRVTVRSGLDCGDLIRAARRIGGEGARLAILRGLLCAGPDNPVAARELASTPDLQDLAEFDWIKGILTRLCLALPLDPVVQNGAGVALEARGRDKAALARHVKAAVLDPGFPAAIFNIGVRARYAGDFERARRWFQRALAISTRDRVFRYNLGHVLLATGRTEAGLPLYEERWWAGRGRSHRRAGPDPSFTQPPWDEAAAGLDSETLLIWGEQGIGDETWFAGYVPRLFADNPTVLECDPRLVTLFARSGLATSVVPRTDPAHAATGRTGRQIAAGSLPFLANTRSPGAATPAPRGYLVADQSRADAYRARLAAIGPGRTIGVSWRSRKPVSSQTFEADPRYWRPIFEIKDAIFVNLQYDMMPWEMEWIQEQFAVRLVCLDDLDPFHDIDGLAALMSVLDDVVSIANVNVALCHGLGRSCHVALRSYQEDWRFQRDRSTSCWLPDCHLYWPEDSEGRGGGWGNVFSRIAGEIAV